VSTAQVIFSIALAVISGGIVAFAAYVVASTAWGGRWVKFNHRSAGTEKK
jgi:hypothetical protein